MCWYFLPIDIYGELRTVLYSDSAVASEASGLAMGLVMLGTASSKAIQEMVQYAHETRHEKIIRGLAIGMSLIMYGKEEQADALIEELCGDKVRLSTENGFIDLSSSGGRCIMRSKRPTR